MTTKVPFLSFPKRALWRWRLTVVWPANGRGTAMLVGMGLALEPPCYFRWASQVALVVKSLAADAGDTEMQV